MAARTLAVVVSIGCVVACSRRSEAPQPRPDEASARIASWRADLTFLANELPRRHIDPFFHVRETDFRAAVAALDRTIASASDAQIISGIVRIAAMIGDAHTAVALANRGGIYPLALYDFSDGMFVVGAPADAAWAIGAKLVGIGNRSIDDARTALEPLIAHDNDAGIRAGLPAALVSPILLAGSGLAPDDRHVSYRLALADGDTRELALEPGLAPTALARPATMPLYIQQPRLPYWKSYDADRRLLYIQYNQCREGDPPLATFVASIFDTLEHRPIDRVVIDLRHNGGGNSALLDPFIHRLAARRDLAGHVYAVIGRRTFSSAVLNAIALHRAGAILVGEPTAGKPSHHGEVRSFTLPTSELPVTYSTKFFANGDVEGDALRPDIAVAASYADWAAGRDPVLDAILGHASR